MSTTSVCNGGPVTEGGVTSLFKSNGLMATSGTTQQTTRFGLLIVGSVVICILLVLVIWMSSKAKKKNKDTFIDLGAFSPTSSTFGFIFAMLTLVITMYVVSAGFCWSYYLATVILILIALLLILFAYWGLAWCKAESKAEQVRRMRSTGTILTMVELSVLVLLLIAPSSQGTRSNVVATIAFIPTLLIGFSTMYADLFQKGKQQKNGALAALGLGGGAASPEEEVEEM